MILDFESLDEILPRVNKPARYVGGEWNTAVPAPEADVFRIALAFPDIYEVGMSYLGFKIFYRLLNRMPGVSAERVYAPWPDMERELRDSGIPLYSLETFLPLAEFDLAAFTLSHELSYTNILTMLDLGGVPLHAGDRGRSDPLVIAGGYGAFNPEPLAAFFDAFYIGEGEEGFPELVTRLQQLKDRSATRGEQLAALAGIPGVYVPARYREQNVDGQTVCAAGPVDPAAPARIRRRIVADLDGAFHHRTDFVPFMDTIHNRAAVEIMRGCVRGCRFCNAGMLFRPVRERSAETVCSIAREMAAATGYDEVALCSLSTTDHSQIETIVGELKADFGPARIALSLPSLRADRFSAALAESVGQVRRTGLTFAPEAGSQRLRDVINKGVTEDDLLATVARAASRGWQRVKLYFMVGLPSECREDLEAIVSLVRAVRKTGRENARRGFRVNVSINPFCPKPHTPFQWAAQDTRETFGEKMALLRSRLKIKGVKVSCGSGDAAWLEAVITRGDRRVGGVIERAWRYGARMDSWTECFKPAVWEAAFEAEGLDPEWFSSREWSAEQVLPWHHIDAGVTGEFLSTEYRRALEGLTSPDCLTGACIQCGAC